ncbi:nucleotide sugar dehydrogenase [Kineosporia sp. A_224]|uniref:nucleotide sugar dehydrogenase n=1 Tax=Kineosporia sp. A_224 TaxID=1962180 RepID=UPI000B4BAC2C
MKVAVFGLGYVGTVTAAGLASVGHDVVGVDVDPVKVDLVTAARSPVVEPGILDLLADAVAAGRLRATTQPQVALDGADVSLICVGTPSSPQGSTDLTYLDRALDGIRAAMAGAAPPASGRHVVVVRSTVPPGTVEEHVVATFAGAGTPAGWAVSAAMCPEFLREGSGVHDFFHPPFVVIGTQDPAAEEVLRGLFAFLDQQPHVVDLRVAEALKYACNAFHATKVSFTNELARIFRALDVNSREVMDIFCEDTVLNVSPAYLRPGFAFGGSCLPKDLRSLLHMARANALDAPLLASTIRTNELVVSDIVDRVVAGPDRRVAVLGLSFKMHTDDLRESPNVDLAERLVGKGFDVRIYDPIVNPDQLVGSNLRYMESRLPHLGRLLSRDPGEALEGAGTAVVSTTCPEVLAALEAQPPARIIDLVGRLGHGVESLPGYEGIGWPA